MGKLLRLSGGGTKEVGRRLCLISGPTHAGLCKVSGAKPRQPLLVPVRFGI